MLRHFLTKTNHLLHQIKIMTHHKTADPKYIENNNSVPVEIWVNIFYYVNTKTLLKMQEICTEWKNIIRSFVWYKTINPKNIPFYKYLISNYCFTSYSAKRIYLSATKIGLGALWNAFNEFILNLRNVKSVDLIGFNLDLTRNDISNHLLILSKMDTLNLTNYNWLTDDMVILLGNVHTLILSDCHNITDKSMSAIKNIHKLDLSGCHQITDYGISQLINVKKLNVSRFFKKTIRCILSSSR